MSAVDIADLFCGWQWGMLTCSFISCAFLGVSCHS